MALEVLKIVLRYISLYLLAQQLQKPYLHGMMRNSDRCLWKLSEGLVRRPFYGQKGLRKFSRTSPTDFECIRFSPTNIVGIWLLTKKLQLRHPPKLLRLCCLPPLSLLSGWFPDGIFTTARDHFLVLRTFLANVCGRSQISSIFLLYGCVVERNRYLRWWHGCENTHLFIEGSSVTFFGCCDNRRCVIRNHSTANYDCHLFWSWHEWHGIELHSQTFTYNG